MSAYWNFVTQMVPATLAKAEDVNTNLSGIDNGFALVEVEINKCLQITNSPGVVDVSLNAAARANKLISFDVNGDITATTIMGDWKGDHAAAAGTDYTIRDIVKDATAALGQDNLYICITTHTSTGDLATDTANWELLVDAAQAMDWAQKTDGIVDAVDYSAKAYAVGGTGVTSTATKGAAKEWAITTGALVDTAEYSAKEYAIGTTVPAGSAKDWAIQAEDSVVDGGSGYSALHWAAKAAATYDLFDDRMLGTFTNATEPALDNDGDALTAGVMYFNSDINRLKIYNGAAWQIITAAASDVTITDAGAIYTATDVEAALQEVMTDVNAINVASLGFTATASEVNAICDGKTLASTDDKIDNFPAGTLMLFQQTAAPTGWTKQTTHNNKALRVVSGTAGSGGATAFTTVFGAGKVVGGTAITTAQMPSHNHSASSGNQSANHTHNINNIVGDSDTTYTFSTYGVDSGAGQNVLTNPVASLNTTFDYSRTSTNNSANHNHSITVNSTGSGSTHNHTLSLDLQYVDLIIASKD